MHAFWTFLIGSTLVLVGQVTSLITTSNRPAKDSCATFVMTGPEGPVAGHNLDEGISVPGLVVVNPRGMTKENRTYDDIKSRERSTGIPRLTWVSKYGSLTTNTFGREFPDGGLNEAGLYVGEMSLLTTEWPEGGSQVRFYHHQWIQYLLDNFSTVKEALASLKKAFPEGHCKWHFLLADRTGESAVVEFHKGKPTIFQDKALPYPILGNDGYQLELDDIKNYQGFGGTKDPEPKYEREDPRFRWMAVMLKNAKSQKLPDYAFALLKRIDLGTTKWSIVYDIKNFRMWFRTNVSQKIKRVDLSAFDFSCTTIPPALDIHSQFEGDVSKQFSPLTDAINKKAVEASFEEIDAGFAGNLFWKPKMIKGLTWASRSFKCNK